LESSEPLQLDIDHVVSCIHTHFDAGKLLIFVGTEDGFVLLYRLFQSQLDLVSTISVFSVSIAKLVFDSAIPGIREHGILFAAQNELIDSGMISAIKVTPSNTSKLGHIGFIYRGGIIDCFKCTRFQDHHFLFTVVRNRDTTDLTILATSPANPIIGNETITMSSSDEILDIDVFPGRPACSVFWPSTVTIFRAAQQPKAKKSEQKVEFSAWFRSATFPFTKNLREEIQNRRHILKSSLLIDELLSLLGIESHLVYPPPDWRHLEKLVSMVIDSTNLDLQRKHCVLYYFIKDANPSKQQQFAKTFQIPKPFLLAIDGSWNFDRGNFTVIIS
jgi:hypothetical protein